ncbi:suppressor of fused domain protein [Bordetella sp. LUAb4]|uniref:suppressor of fused domain protein n=1 Tax=Bordetella sp. LUAb4 TaxID=2843195 RepID=UPI001E32B1FA|nr:suppressor of fused domain protein [Bordetella sp. LUAb4]
MLTHQSGFWGNITEVATEHAEQKPHSNYMIYIDHLEQYLGQLAEGWADPEGGSIEESARVVRFAGQPFPEASVYATVGLGRTVVDLPRGRSMRQELLFATYDIYPASEVASFLLTFAGFVHSKGKALLRGDVVGPSTSLIPGVAANGVYASMPAIFPDGIVKYLGSSPPTIAIWLIPLVGSECESVKKDGWDYFENMLETRNPDLFDLDRPPLLSK